MLDRQLVLVPPERIAAVFASQRLYSPQPKDTALADDILWNGLSFVGAYYDCVFATLDCPTWQQFLDRYLDGNSNEVTQCGETVATAMQWRAIRHYNGQVLEHQLMGYMSGFGMFRSVSKSEALDTKSSVDVVLVLHDGRQVGLAMSSKSKLGEHYRDKKARRQKTRDHNGDSTWNGPIIEACYDYAAMLKIPAYRPTGKECTLSVFTAATARALANHVYNGVGAPVPPPLSKDLPFQHRLFPCDNGRAPTDDSRGR